MSFTIEDVTFEQAFYNMTTEEFLQLLLDNDLVDTDLAPSDVTSLKTALQTAITTTMFKTLDIDDLRPDGILTVMATIRSDDDADTDVVHSWLVGDGISADSTVRDTKNIIIDLFNADKANLVNDTILARINENEDFGSATSNTKRFYAYTWRANLEDNIGGDIAHPLTDNLVSKQSNTICPDANRVVLWKTPSASYTTGLDLLTSPATIWNAMKTEPIGQRIFYGFLIHDPQRPYQLISFKSGSSFVEPSGGTWRVTYNGNQTSAIAYNASRATVISTITAAVQISEPDTVVDVLPISTSVNWGWYIYFYPANPAPYCEAGVKTLMTLSNSLTGAANSTISAGYSYSSFDALDQSAPTGSRVKGALSKGVLGGLPVDLPYRTNTTAWLYDLFYDWFEAFHALPTDPDYGPPTIDYILCDIEDSHADFYSFYVKEFQLGTSDQLKDELYVTVARDSRFNTELKPRLGNYAANDFLLDNTNWESSGAVRTAFALHSPRLWFNPPYYTVQDLSQVKKLVMWLGLDRDRLAEYQNDTFFEAAKAFYPNIKMSNYDQSMSAHTGRQGTVAEYPWYSVGNYAGTHQTRSTYVSLEATSIKIEAPTSCPPADNPFSTTVPFPILRIKYLERVNGQVTLEVFNSNEIDPTLSQSGLAAAKRGNGQCLNGLKVGDKIRFYPQCFAENTRNYPSTVDPDYSLGDASPVAGDSCGTLNPPTGQDFFTITSILPDPITGENCILTYDDPRADNTFLHKQGFTSVTWDGTHIDIYFTSPITSFVTTIVNGDRYPVQIRGLEMEEANGIFLGEFRPTVDAGPIAGIRLHDFNGNNITASGSPRTEGATGATWSLIFDGLSSGGTAPSIVTYDAWRTFNSLIKQLRAMAICSKIPIDQWTTTKYYVSFWGFPEYRTSDLYQEMLYHYLLTGNSDRLLYYQEGDKWRDFDNQNYDLLVSNLLKEVDSVIGFDDVKPLSVNLREISFRENYIISGVSCHGRKIFRFTPQLGSEYRLSDSAPVDVTMENCVLNTANPVVFQLNDGNVLIIKNAVLLNPTSYSSRGFWVQQTESPVVTPPEPPVNPGDGGGSGGTPAPVPTREPIENTIGFRCTTDLSEQQEKLIWTQVGAGCEKGEKSCSNNEAYVSPITVCSRREYFLSIQQ